MARQQPIACEQQITMVVCSELALIVRLEAKEISLPDEESEAERIICSHVAPFHR